MLRWSLRSVQHMVAIPTCSPLLSTALASVELERQDVIERLLRPRASWQADGNLRPFGRRENDASQCSPWPSGAQHRHRHRPAASNEGDEVALSHASLRSYVGFVPQEDTATPMPMLTVREKLRYAARVRLPREWSNKRIDSFVSSTIAELGLSDVVDSMVGDTERRRISGGERRRLNIGIELVAALAPKALLCDELHRACCLGSHATST